jgi:hypothetical protein
MFFSRIQFFPCGILQQFGKFCKINKLNKNIMMEVMIPNRERFYEFDQTDISKEVGKLLYSESAIPASKSQFFQALHF